MGKLLACAVSCMLSISVSVSSAQTLETTALGASASLVQAQAQASALTSASEQTPSSLMTPQVLQAAPSKAQQTSPPASQFRQFADALARQISPAPQGLERLFAPDFLQIMPPDALIASFQGLYASFGKVETVSLLSSPDSTNTADFLFTFDDFRMDVELSISTSTPPLISHLQLRAAYPTIAAVIEQLRRLPGQVNFELASLDPAPRPIYSLNADAPLAIGSVFKLYVLSALVQERKSWNDTIEIRNKLKSLPSGVTQNLPEGTYVSVLDMASKMISISDNTATDHLLDYVGRNTAERMLGVLGNSHPRLSTPFLFTSEMFKLKFDDSLRSRYLAAGLAGKYALLAGNIRQTPLPPLTWASEWTNPIAIDSLEWFASASDLCRAMDWFRNQEDKTARDILAINPGLPFPKGKFAYVGHKGGSEPGVLDMTWLLKTIDGHSYALSAAWNNPAAPVDQIRFFQLMRNVINLIPEIPAQER